MATQDVIQYRFKKGQSGNPAGRPRKLVSKLIELGYKQSEVSDTFLSLLAMTKDELKQISENPNATVLEISIAEAIQKGIKNKNLLSIEIILDRALGRPKEMAEIKQGINLQAFEVTVRNIDIAFVSCESDIKTE